MRPEEQVDPYAPPPRHKERSGAVVRLAIVAVLLGAAAWGYAEYSSQPQTALVGPPAEEQMAENDNAMAQRAEPAPPPADSAESTPRSAEATPSNSPGAGDQPPA